MHLLVPTVTGPPFIEAAVRSLVHGLCAAPPCLLWDYQTLVFGGGGVKVAMGRTPCGPGMPVRSGGESWGGRGDTWGWGRCFCESCQPSKKQAELKRLAKENNPPSHPKAAPPSEILPASSLHWGRQTLHSAAFVRSDLLQLNTEMCSHRCVTMHHRLIKTLKLVKGVRKTENAP